nr:MAG TPA: hypothetical protein [Caudoviricetes sp.]DAP61317.1 MAG TPA: hypothetical protein [Caudoviricetes sp.]
MSNYIIRNKKPQAQLASAPIIMARTNNLISPLRWAFFIIHNY